MLGLFVNLAILCLVLSGVEGFAQSDRTFSQTPENQLLQAPSPFNETHLGVSANRNFPLGRTRNEYGSSRRQNLSVIYRHLLSSEWLAGIQVGFKSFEIKDSDDDLNALCLTHEIYRLVRIYYPWYLGAGLRIHYLAPVVKQTIPTKRLPLVSTEVALAGSMMIMTKISPTFNAHVYLDRWRGTTTNRFHGYEFGVGLTYDGLN